MGEGAEGMTLRPSQACGGMLLPPPLLLLGLGLSSVEGAWMRRHPN